MEENNQFPEEKNLQAEEKIKKTLLWFGIFSIIMLFAGITSGYIVARDSSFWVNLKLPNWDSEVDFPVLVYSWDIPKIAEAIEEFYEETTDISLLFDLINEKIETTD